jgi:hypothetical protein
VPAQQECIEDDVVAAGTGGGVGLATRAAAGMVRESSADEDVTMSIVITWVFNHTRESLPVAILIRASNNTVFEVVWPAVFPGCDESRGTWLAMVIGYGQLALVLIAWTRGRLGWKPRCGTVDVEPSASAGG